VLGSIATIPNTKAPAKATGGVLGSIASIATSPTLPFTGLRLWIVELVALGLLGTGFALRLLARRGAER
jgi:hypothetical protein